MSLLEVRSAVRCGFRESVRFPREILEFGIAEVESVEFVEGLCRSLSDVGQVNRETQKEKKKKKNLSEIWDFFIFSSLTVYHYALSTCFPHKSALVACFVFFILCQTSKIGGD